MNPPKLGIGPACVYWIHSLKSALAALVLTVPSARAAQITWTNTAGGNWNNAANWNPNQVPGDADDALITSTGTYFVTLDIDVALNSLTLGGSGGTQGLDDTSHNLTLNGASGIKTNGVLNLEGGVLAGGGLLTIHGRLNWTGGRIGTGSVLTVATNGVLVTEGGTLEFSGILTNAGTIKLTGGNFRCMVYASYGGGYGLLVNAPGGLIDFQADVPLAYYNDNSGAGTPALINQGLVRKSGGSGTSTVDAPLYNSGTLDVQSGTVALNGGGNGTGVFQAEAGATLAYPASYEVDGMMTGPGTNLLNGGVLALKGTIAGQFVWVSGRLATNTTGTVAANGVLVGAGTGGDLEFSGILTNAGTIKLTSGNFRCIAYFPYGGGYGLLVNAPGGLIDFQADVPLASFNDGSGVGAPTLINQGTIRKSGGSGLSVINPLFYNSGTLDVQTGSISLHGGGNGNGVFRAEAGATLDFSFDYRVDSGLTGAGTNTFSGGAVALNGTLATSNAVLSAGVLGGTNAVIADLLTWTGGRIGPGSTFTLAANGVLVGAGAGGDLDFLGILTNAGTIKLTSGNFRCIAYFPYGGGYGLLVNAPGGLIDFQADVGIAYYNDNSGAGMPALVNQGTVRKSGGSGTSSINAPLYNSGTLDVQSGTVAVNGGGNGTGIFQAEAGATLAYPSNYEVDGVMTGPGTNLLNGGILELKGTIAGQFVWVSGRLGPNTTGTVAASGVLVGAGAGGTLEFSGILTNAGTIKLASGIFRCIAYTPYGGGYGLLVNSPGGLIDFQADVPLAAYNDGTGVGAPALINRGTIRKSGGTGLSSINPPFDNQSGAIGVERGQLSVGSSSYLQGAGPLTIQLGGVAAGQFGELITDSSASLGGPLNVNLASGFVPALGNEFQILACASRGNTFATLQMPTGISVNYSNNGVFLVVTGAVSTLQITGQPANQTVVVGGTAMFTVSATGTAPLTYRWQKNGANLTDGGNVFGSATSVLTISNVSAANVGIYAATITNAAGSTLTSSNATLTLLSCLPPPSGLVSWWPGDGNANDIIGPNNGALQNGATFAAGKVGQAFSFDGVDDEVVVPHNANQNPGSQITMDAWVNPGSSGHGRTILQKRSASNVGGYVFETVGQPFGPDNGLQFVITIGGAFHTCATATGVLTLNTWQHVAATYDGAMMKIYVNGVEKASVAQTGAIDAVTDPIVIGRNVVLPADAWQGLMDEIELFNRALSASEIQAIFNAGSAGQCKPVCALTCPANIVATNTAGLCGTIVNYTTPISSGSCGAVTCTPANGSFFAVGSTAVSCTTTNGGNCSFTVTVLDNQHPTITCPTNLVLSTSPGLCSRTNVDYSGIGTFDDNCLAATAVQTAGLPSGSTFPKGTTTNRFVVTDASGNTATCSFTVTIHDTEPPTITCSTNVVADAPPGQTTLVVNFAAATATDNCPGVTASCAPPSGSTFPLGMTPVVCTATDSASNTNSCTFTVTVNSTTTNTPPAITCPANITTNNAPGLCARALAFAPTATGNPAPPVVCKIGSTEITSPYAFPVGTNTVVCTATNIAGTASCSFTVTVKDTEPPVLNGCPTNNYFLLCFRDPPGPANVTATDNCDGIVPVIFTQTQSHTNFSCDNIITWRWTATDRAGNSASCTQTLTVHDTEGPVISGCSNTTVAAPSGQLGATMNFAVTATDFCYGPVPVTCTPKPGYFALGQTPVTCEAVDQCGNRSTCSFTVTLTARTDAIRLCSFTQGFYGNANGKFNGNTSFTLVGQMLSQGPLVVGKAGVRSLSILEADAALLQQRLPSGGAPAALPNNGDQTLPTAVLPLNSKGRFADVFLGQTITLSLNVRLRSALSAFGLTASFCSQAVLAGPDGLKGTADDVLVAGDIQMFSIPAPVLSALANLGLPPTVDGLLELANRALAGLPTGGATLSDINAAVDAVNRGFDECRAPVNCATSTVVPDSFNDSFTNRPALGSGGPVSPGPQGPNGPNPPSGAPLNIRVRSSNLAAIKEPGEPDIAGNPGGKSVWWQWQAPLTGPVTVATAGSSFDTLLGAYTGTAFSNLVLVASNDDARGALTSEVTFQAQAGTNYQIAVDGANAASGEIVLTLIVDPPRLCLPVAVVGNQVQFCIAGEVGRAYTVEASLDLANWTLLATALNGDGTLRFTDPAMSNFPRHFYRVTFEP